VSPIVGLVTFLVPHSQVISSQPKSLNLGSSAPNPIVFASLDSNNLTQPQIMERPTLSFPKSESSDTEDGPLEKQKSTGMASFGGHEVA
jgi:hypothetical protein